MTTTLRSFPVFVSSLIFETRLDATDSMTGAQSYRGVQIGAKFPARQLPHARSHGQTRIFTKGAPEVVLAEIERLAQEAA